MKKLRLVPLLLLGACTAPTHPSEHAYVYTIKITEISKVTDTIYVLVNRDETLTPYYNDIHVAKLGFSDVYRTVARDIDSYVVLSQAQVPDSVTLKK